MHLLVKPSEFRRFHARIVVLKGVSSVYRTTEHFIRQWDGGAVRVIILRDFSSRRPSARAQTAYCPNTDIF